MSKQGDERIARDSVLSNEDLVFDFMLNALRLIDGFDAALFSSTTGLPFSCLQPTLQIAQQKGLLEVNESLVRPTELGFRFLNDLQELFLDVKLARNQAFFTSVGQFIHTQDSNH